MNKIEQFRKTMHRRLSSDRSGGAGTAIVAVIIIAIVAIVGFMVVANGNHAALDINVQSTHILANTDVTVYVDGSKIGTWRVGNLNTLHVNYDYSWSAFDSSKIIEVKAISTGGYLGAQGDSSLVTVYKGGTSKVTLFI